MNELLTQYDISYDSFKLSIGGRNSNDTMDSDYGSIETASSVEQVSYIVDLQFVLKFRSSEIKCTLIHLN